MKILNSTTLTPSLDVAQVAGITSKPTFPTFLTMYVNVYTGMWADYSNGRITGAIITLTARNDSILVAALSIFLVVVGSQFWSILTFDIHWMNATDKITDIMHFQHQATFRNAGTSIGATQELLALPFPWRRRQTGPRDFSVTILRSWAWALLALTNFCV
ncbi:hypothetical protein FOYG_02101 [Fusarium oxysporum NRRL 32931]|uniref:Uncharacterized protein n=1 Tax=Fusarium oxysporum NRRL 32931 TaxID=660029 RepID=W9JDE9_FUSOX|nr:hypothetical protein FOYG_02101 [Fusarium oxysporum NRRL 32931]